MFDSITSKRGKKQRNREAGHFHAPAVLGATALALIAGVVTPVAAIDFGTPGGNFYGNFNTVISAGAHWRVQDRDLRLIGLENGGTAYSINGDNGNLNYDNRDCVSASIKASHELLLRYQRLDFFTRFFYFYDRQIMDSPTRRTSLTEAAKNERGRDFTLLDAYVALDIPLGGPTMTLRVGNQVLSWGESTFIGNGINTIGPIDVSKLRVAGSELREALKAVPMVQVSMVLTQRLSLEGFYEFAWDHTEIDPEGTFFSTSDLASPGGQYAFLGFGRPGISDDPPLIAGNPPVGTAYLRSADIEARDSGEFGVALRWFEPKLGSTELGFYFHRLHSRLPLISGRTGTLAALGGGDYASSANMFRVFPEDIDTYGIGFNTDLGSLGTALQGEIMYRRNQPLQNDTVELSYAMLSPLDPYLDPENPDLVLFGHSQLGAYDFEQEVQAYRRKSMAQAQVSATQVFGPRLGADQHVLLVEAGVTHVVDMEDPRELNYESPGTGTSTNPLYTEAGIQPVTQTEGLPNDISWGYRAVFRSTFNNAVGAWNLSPYVAFAHDPGGTTPAPISNFVEARKTITMGITAVYLFAWRVGFSYTNSWGAGGFNERNDRDFVSLTGSIAF